MSNPKPCSLVSRQTRGHLIECLVEWLHRNLLVPGEGIIHGECEQQRQRDECGSVAVISVCAQRLVAPKKAG